MKYIFYLTAILICVSTSSCKKDYDIDDFEQVQLEGELSIPNFYYRGIIEDLVKNEEIILNRETIITEEEVEDFSFVESTSGQGTQSINGNKFVVSATGRGSTQHVMQEESGNEEDVMLGGRHQIAVKIVSERRGDDWKERFLREELMNLLKEGDIMQFGIDPGQVEIAFHHLDFDEFPPYTTRQYQGYSVFSSDTSEDTFEILKVENYENVHGSNPKYGFIVTAKINCTLGNKVGEEISLDLKLRDVEATFLFLYQ